MFRTPTRSPRALVLGGVAVLALLTGCGGGSDAFSENLPDDQADAPQQVVRTPGPIAPDLPYETPPLVVPLPGATGGTPGGAPTESGDSGDGETGDEG